MEIDKNRLGCSRSVLAGCVRQWIHPFRRPRIFCRCSSVGECLSTVRTLLQSRRVLLPRREFDIRRRCFIPHCASRRDVLARSSRAASIASKPKYSSKGEEGTRESQGYCPCKGSPYGIAEDARVIEPATRSSNLLKRNYTNQTIS